MEELYIELIALCYKNDKANFIKKITRASVKDIYKFRRATLLVRKINKLKIYFSNINKHKEIPQEIKTSIDEYFGLSGYSLKQYMTLSKKSFTNTIKHFTQTLESEKSDIQSHVQKRI